MQWLLRMGMMALALVALTACSGGPLRTLDKPGEGPDEFRIVPAKPLETPPDYASLPTPTPGGANITDQTPLADGVAALGGRAPAGADGIPAADGSLVNQASRFGRDGTIRQVLAAEDEEFRARRGRFTQIRIVRSDRYNDVYRPLALDPFREVSRWRSAGARTPTSPPGGS
jgi:hypothetical protein